MLPPMSDTPPRPARPINRRILSLWFPRLPPSACCAPPGPALAEIPLAVVAETGNLREIASLNAAASARGLRRGQRWPRR